jgi:hypothetical protein
MSGAERQYLNQIAAAAEATIRLDEYGALEFRIH